MKWFDDLTIFRKLILAFLVAGLMTATMGGFSITRLNALDQKVAEMTDNWLPGIEALTGMKADLIEYRTYEIQLAYAKDESLTPDYLKRMKRLASASTRRTPTSRGAVSVDPWKRGSTKPQMKRLSGIGQRVRRSRR
jgi:hypothetical protein